MGLYEVEEINRRTTLPLPRFVEPLGSCSPADNMNHRATKVEHSPAIFFSPLDRLCR